MPLTKQYYNGFGSAADGNKQGWVSPKYALEVPAPVISYSSKGKGYWSLTEINPSLVGEPAELISEAGNKFKLISNNLSITIDLSDPRMPNYTQMNSVFLKYKVISRPNLVGHFKPLNWLALM
jgi:hypothetical protein